MEGSFDWRFEPEDDGVRVTIEHHPGRLWSIPILGRLLARSYERTDQEVLARLKAKLESTDPSVLDPISPESDRSTTYLADPAPINCLSCRTRSG